MSTNVSVHGTEWVVKKIHIWIRIHRSATKKKRNGRLFFYSTVFLTQNLMSNCCNSIKLTPICFPNLKCTKLHFRSFGIWLNSILLTALWKQNMNGLDCTCFYQSMKTPHSSENHRHVGSKLNCTGTRPPTSFPELLINLYCAVMYV